MADGSTTVTGEARLLGGPGGAPGDGAFGAATPGRATLAFGDDEVTVALAARPPIIAAYRDIASIVVQPGAVLLVLGGGDGALRVILERFGERTPYLVTQLRERRMRQRLADRFVRLDDDPIELVEYRRDGEHGVAQVAFSPWTAELWPIDERLAPIHLRRGDIGAVAADPTAGGVTVGWSGWAPGVAGSIDLVGLGAAATRLGARFAGLRDAAAADAARIVAGLVPDASFGSRQRLAGRLVDGRPVAVGDLGEDGPALEAALLTEPTFAESYHALIDRAAAASGDDAGPRWVALAPDRPGGDGHRAWFLVGLPGNLVALELVSEGAHATYLFRAVPRAVYGGESPAALAEPLGEAVRVVSEALVDSRFLREPMALPPDRLATARYRHYRLALAALPSLAEARRRFVARLVHDDHARWAAALDGVIAWHATVRDETAEWPGRAAEEAVMGDALEEAGTGTGGTAPSSGHDAPD